MERAQGYLLIKINEQINVLETAMLLFEFIN